MPSKTSKTARRSTVGSAKSRKPNVAPNVPRLIPTGGGQWSYVLTDVGSTVHVRVGTPEFQAAVSAAVSVAGQDVLDAAAGFAARWPDAGWELAAGEVDDLTETAETVEAA